jgi:VanZ family protein
VRRPARTSVRRGGARVLLALAVLGHLMVLYAPRAPSAGGVPGVDKLVHVAVFAAVVWAARLAGVGRRVAGVLLLAHAPVSEALQHWVLPARSGDPVDVLADAAGVLVGLLLAVPGERPGARMGPWRRGRERRTRAGR